ncbi:MAG TPA: cupin domain-containing protein [Terriglobales bacterium]|nr:cupin domain-containing protein [Terriglobales bacterium]
MRVRFAFYILLVCLALAVAVAAQDAVKVDSQHYSVVSENDEVRILKVHYGPHEKSVMHSHPDSVAVFLGDGKGKFTFPDGKTQDFDAKTGQAQYEPAVTHLPENSGENPLDVIVVELKGHAGHKKNKTK